jgi:glucose-1-phosphate thymidylyltransferase
LDVALVPAAGRGTRLGRIGAALPKALVPIGGRPAIDHILEMLRNAGIARVFLVVGYKKEQLISYVEDGSDFGLNVAYLTQPNPKGIANALLQAESFIYDDFVCLLGDTILNPGNSVKDLVDFHLKKKPAATLLVTHVSDVRGYGIIEPEGEEVRGVVEKPRSDREAPSELAIVGCYSFSPKIFAAAKDTAPNQRTGEIELTDAIQKLIETGERVCYLRFEGTYLDTGKLEKDGSLGSFENRT